MGMSLSSKRIQINPPNTGNGTKWRCGEKESGKEESETEELGEPRLLHGEIKHEFKHRDEERGASSGACVIRGKLRRDKGETCWILSSKQ